ncbi:transcriptional regulator [Cucurbitaria berberidis CBS 394.84]|uniref:Transcriptional regulator n=1 Tax=Cucurbitaria berberidis CBS 394.84 TaxID=1168544 RepID=A0A9P4G752_9PLEO|nr:transcriptional regulator [Cucurbitaria berberidis CBS 394.84]KAF1840161.1 transcriptional regulator [Cucurbitaria berberidis CBS 394.84]
MPGPFKVAVYLYPNADLLDFSGPVEIYSCRPFDGPSPFSITSFAHHNPIQTDAGALVYTPNATFAEIEPKIEDFDILVIPGAGFDTIQKLIESEEGKQLGALLQKFAGSAPRKETGKRILQSVCSGSILVAAAGLLAGRTATTHHLGLEMLKRVADDAAAGGRSNINVVRKRWVDAGTTDAGVRIVNAGGVSSGLDSSLWIVEQVAGKQAADWASEVAEFERRDAAWGVEV